MSSREIAELTGKRHDHVCRDIRNMLSQLGLAETSFRSGYFDANNQQRTEYRLPRRECEILVCGYDVVRRAAVIDRWLELETKQRQLPNMTPGPLRFTVDQGMIG
ncbi:Rha family transcriptional regulator [Shewanella algae]|uniref:Rha family transcriptional regulator n=1 Tax=Shewanella algae TaxID=38313 RepID=UPI001C5A4CFE|nr:Rha family transcriptional regulator [Shewanella algae]